MHPNLRNPSYCAAKVRLHAQKDIVPASSAAGYANIGGHAVLPASMYLRCISTRICVCPACVALLLRV